MVMILLLLLALLNLRVLDMGLASLRRVLLPFLLRLALLLEWLLLDLPLIDLVGNALPPLVVCLLLPWSHGACR